MDKSHGSPYDRGMADSYYGRPFRPHHYPGKGGLIGGGVRVETLTKEQEAEYRFGYEENEYYGEKKDWG